MTRTQALRIISSAAVNGDYIDDETLGVIEQALSTSDVTVPAPRADEFEPFRLECPIIDSVHGACELGNGHRGPHMDADYQTFR